MYDQTIEYKNESSVLETDSEDAYSIFSGQNVPNLESTVRKGSFTLTLPFDLSTSS